MNERPYELLKKVINFRLNLDEDKADEIAIIASINKGIEFKGVNLWTLIFAILIASIGLNVNSTAVIIGAMLISPLMGPIMGIGLGTGILDFELVKHAFKNYIIAIVIGLTTSALYFTISPIHHAQSELLARTIPTIWDVLIAFFGGLAGIVAGSRKHFSNVIPGVAIATALMPPLCTAGFGIANHNWSYFAGAIYLLIINTVFISLSTFLIVRFLKFKKIEYADKVIELKVRRYIAIIVGLTILPSIYLAYLFVGQEIFRQKLNTFINNEIKNKEIVVIDQVVNLKEKSASLVLIGEDLNQTVVASILSNKNKYGLENSEININENIKLIPDVTTYKTNIVEELYKKEEQKILAKNQLIKELEVENLKLKSNFVADERFKKEFEALFGTVKELSLAKAPVISDEEIKDSCLLLYISSTNGKANYNTKQISSWLSAKFNSKKVNISIED